ncbi:MAG: PASTA domain-containing protein, partial [Actinomycetia bacterium]|nr:PASTA domain-containing protein [Actinomycetes bacterium]
LFELLTGQTPFAGASPMSVAYQHVHEQIPAPSSLGVPVPEPLDQLVLRATNRHPGRRPANAGAFLAELHDVAAELGFPVLPVPARQRPAGRPLAPAVPPRAPPPLGPTKPSAAPTTQLRATRSARTTAPLTPGPHPNDTLIGRPVPLPAELPPDRSQAADPVLRYGSVARRRRRRWRRTLIALLILALLGGATGYTSWWFASGRYKHLPSVTGQQQDKAVAALNDAGFAHVTVQTAYNNAKPGTVFKTDPAAGTRLLPNRMITIVVSRGPETCPLPKVAGGTEARARAALAGCEFTTGPPLQVVTTQQSSDTVPKDAVIGTEPKAGAKVKPGQAVTLIISTGPPIITVPKVSGLSQDDATNKLQAARFKVVVQQDYSDTVPEGSVISEDPSGGSKAVKFSTVTIQVSLGPHMVTIPKIPMRTSVDDATAMLTDLGLKVTVETEFGGYLGYVVGMDPPAGTVVPVGTTVTLIAV